MALTFPVFLAWRASALFSSAAPDISPLSELADESSPPSELSLSPLSESSPSPPPSPSPSPSSDSELDWLSAVASFIAPLTTLRDTLAVTCVAT